MNAERLLAVVDLLRFEIEKGNRVYEHLDKLQAALREGRSADVRTIKDQIVAVLSKAPSNLLPPSWQAIMEGIGAGKVVGLGLVRRIQALLDDYRLQATEMASIVAAIHAELMAFNGSLNNQSSSAKALGIEPYKLMPGECEIGVLYPEVGVISDLESLVQEVEGLDTALRTLMEVGGAAGSPKIKQATSTELTLFLEVVAGVGVAAALAIDRILDIVKKKYEVDRLRLEIEQGKIDLEAAKLLKSRSHAIEEEGIEKATGEILEVYQGSDEGRKNELMITVRNTLRFMLTQTARGVIFEVTASSETSEGIKIDEAAKGQGPSSIEAQQLVRAQKLGASMKELAAKRDQLLLPNRGEAGEQPTSPTTERNPRKRDDSA